MQLKTGDVIQIAYGSQIVFNEDDVKIGDNEFISPDDNYIITSIHKLFKECDYGFSDYNDYYALNTSNNIYIVFNDDELTEKEITVVGKAKMTWTIV